VTSNGAGLVDFITESNRIERIHTPVAMGELTSYKTLLARGHLTTDAVCSFVVAVAGGRLRDQPGMDVRIGDDRPPAGGPGIRRQLGVLLDAMNEQAISPWDAHLAYVRLHPFTDGNGRSGRALWAWMTVRRDENPFELSFLQRFYYDTIHHARPDDVRRPREG